MAELKQAYREVRAGAGRAVFIRGAGGIGKSRLLSEFAGTIRSNDAHVIVTTVLDYASSPFAPIVAVAEHWLRSQPALFEARPELRSTVDLLVNADAQKGSPSAAERRRFFDSVAELFRQVSDHAPVTIIITISRMPMPGRTSSSTTSSPRRESQRSF